MLWFSKKALLLSISALLLTSSVQVFCQKLNSNKAVVIYLPNNSIQFFDFPEKATEADVRQKIADKLGMSSNDIYLKINDKDEWLEHKTLEQLNHENEKVNIFVKKNA